MTDHLPSGLLAYLQNSYNQVSIRLRDAEIERWKRREVEERAESARLRAWVRRQAERDAALVAERDAEIERLVEADQQVAREHGDCDAETAALRSDIVRLRKEVDRESEESGEAHLLLGQFRTDAAKWRDVEPRMAEYQAAWDYCDELQWHTFAHQSEKTGRLYRLWTRARAAHQPDPGMRLTDKTDAYDARAAQQPDPREALDMEIGMILVGQKPTPAKVDAILALLARDYEPLVRKEKP